MHWQDVIKLLSIVKGLFSNCPFALEIKAIGSILSLTISLQANPILVVGYDFGYVISISVCFHFRHCKFNFVFHRVIAT